MLVLSRLEVEALLDLDQLIDALADAMTDLSAGRASLPPRIAAFVPEREAFLGAMPAYLPSAATLEAKLVSVFPQNAHRGLHTHQALIVAFDPATGSPVGLMDGTAITAMRTGAGSALATRLLARDDATVLAIVGTGVQARSHARAVPRVRQIREVRVAGRTRAQVEDLVGWIQREAGLPARAFGSYEEAVAGADVVCATTHSPTPVVEGAWLRPGTHVTSVGYNPAGRELDVDVIRRASVVAVESRASSLAPIPAGARELTEAVERGDLTAEDVVEVGELVLGTRTGRGDPDQITVYKSVGVGVQDAAAAALVMAAARERGAGRHVDL